MIFKHKKSLYTFFSLTLLGVAVLFALHVPHAYAQQDNGDVFGAQVVDQSGLALGGNSDVRVLVARIINIALGLLGIIAVSLMLYGGFVYMTSQGQEDKIAQAKKILINATIGLAIIMSSFAITKFVISRLGEATGAGVAGPAGGVANDCFNLGLCNGGGRGGGGEVDRCLAAGNHFVVTSISPSTPDDVGTGMTNTAVRVVFSQALAENVNPADIMVVRRGDEILVPAAARRLDPNVIEYIFDQNTDACTQGNPAQGDALSCLTADRFGVEVLANVVDAQNRALEVENECGVFPRESTFVNNEDALDAVAPVFTRPLTLNGLAAADIDAQGLTMARGKEYPIVAEVNDRENVLQGGLSYVRMHLERVDLAPGDAPDSLDYVLGPTIAAGSNSPIPFFYSLFVGNNMPVPSRYRVILQAADIDGNIREQQSHIILVGEKCQNGIQDEGEDGIDVGGECLGDGVCNADWQCVSRKCIDNQCVAYPMITDVDPWEGATGNFVTILGRYFGERAGTVSFGFDANENGTIDDAEWMPAPAPQQCVADIWTDSWVIVSVPDALPIGSQSAVRLVKAVDAPDGKPPFEDTTIDDHGPKTGPRRGLFLKNDISVPGLCSIEQDGIAVNGALPDADIVARGQAFGGAIGNLSFGGFGANVSQWTDTNIFATVPRIAPGRVAVRVESGNTVSNGLPFSIIDPNAVAVQGPRITSVDPNKVTPRSLVTIIGQGFGNQLGIVYVAATADDLQNCGRPDANCLQLQLDLPGACGTAWQDEQIIAQIPLGFAVGEYVLAVKTQPGEQSTPSPSLSIVDGPPLPGICRIDPVQGPAPLAQNAFPLRLTGLNFSLESIVYFSRRGFDPLDMGTWLSSKDHSNPHGGPVLAAVADTAIQTFIPVDANGDSMPSGAGQIKVRGNGAQTSNSIRYTVQDCREANIPIDGFHCCIEGREAGQLKRNGNICEGEVREAGYVWRFTTGKIPNIPEVAEECNIPDWFNENVQVQVPSPAPWVEWQQGNQVCLNASIAVRFIPVEIDQDTINNNTVRLYRCADNEGSPDCSGNNKVPAPEQLDLEYGAQTLFIRNGRDLLAPNTWYHVELADTIRSREAIEVLGQVEFESFPLRKSRPCGQGTAYCFDFKTAGDGVECELSVAGVTPPTYRTDVLGVIQDTRYAKDVNLLNPAHPLYYILWGRGNQTCLPLYVDGLGWAWRTSSDAAAAIVSADAPRRTDSRIIVDARANTAPNAVDIIAELGPEDRFGPKVGSSKLTIELGDPGVTEYWPNCAESCTNAGIGMRFNRPMIPATYESGFSLQRCLDELCVDVEPAQIRVRVVEQTDTTFRVQPDSGLEEGVWYVAGVNENMVSVGRLSEGGDPIPGKSVTPFSWKFRTKQVDGECRIDSVRVIPDPFTARSVGEKTRYTAIPLSSSNTCSPLGQELNPWTYGWQWSTQKPRVATVSTFQTNAEVPNVCGTTCLFQGSILAFDPARVSVRLCGNGRIEAGEDCDIGAPGEDPGVSCTYSCLRPGSDAPLCGNGVVDVVEECDTAIPGENSDIIRANCSDRCLWRGSSQQEPLGQVNVSWCRSGSVTSGEDCDLTISPDEVGQRPGVTAGQTSVGCSAQCLHLGTPLSRAWCESLGGNIPQSAAIACKTATSVCGNNIVEAGEECEFIFNGDGTVNKTSVQIGFGPNRAVAVRDSQTACTNRCVLRDICNTNVPTREHGGVYCNLGEDCSPGCHILGSSVLYSEPSFCGNGIWEIGEFAMCENPDAPAVDPLGQNPVQVVTAVGEDFDLAVQDNAQNNSQQTKVNAQPVQIQREDGQREALPNAALGQGDYSLQCGYVEFGVQDLAESRDGDMESPGNGFWSSWLAVEGQNPGSVTVEKVNAEHHSGQQSVGLAVVNRAQGGALHGGIPTEIGRRYEVSFVYKILLGQFQPSITFGARDANSPALRLDFEGRNDAFAGAGIWQKYSRIITVPNGAQGPMNILVSSNGGGLVYIDDVHILEVRENAVAVGYNDCPQNADNSRGVATNSCCYPRPSRESEYPADGAGQVCRNTSVQVDFVSNIGLDERTIPGNIILAEGHTDVNFNCAAEGGRDITSQVNRLLAFDGMTKPGFFEKIWQGVKRFFTRLFVGDARAQGALPGEPIPTAVWCADVIRTTAKITTEVDAGNLLTTNHIQLDLSDILQPNTQYAVLIKGGEIGLRNTIGVGIRAKVMRANVPYENNDVFTFRTNEDICRIASVSIIPDKQLFVAPGEERPFVAEIESTTGQKIQSVPGVYAWGWSWGPIENPLYDIPALPAEDVNVDRVSIAARGIEGQLAAVAQAHVTEDVSGSPLATFSGFTALTSDFCANPWPARDQFPFQDLVYNVRMSYCADIGNATTVDDDLPLLSAPVVTVQRANQQPNNPNLPPQVATQDVLQQSLFFNPKNDDVIGLQIFKNPDGLSARSWLAETFRNEINLAQFRGVTIDGYEGVTDGSSVYVSALNLVSHGGGSREIFGNIYQISVNPNAQDSTRQIFEQLLQTLTFNINITDFGYCLSNVVPVMGKTLPFSEQMLSTLAEPAKTCGTDFDCRDAFGTPLVGTNGMCSNAKTKFSRDWKRLSDVGFIQTELAQYRNTTNQQIDSGAGQNENQGQYPQLAGGTFIPQYTNSQWPSWGLLAQQVGVTGLPNDELNRWSACGVCSALDPNGNTVSCTGDLDCAEAGGTCSQVDAQTCWDEQASVYVCPQYSSVIEYSSTGAKNYTVHIPLEFFDQNEPIVRDLVQTSNEVDGPHFTTRPWCAFDPQGGVRSPFGGRCGDSVVGQGEECDPAGTVERRGEGVVGLQEVPGHCAIEVGKACVGDADCRRYENVPYQGRQTPLFTSQNGFCALTDKGDNNRPLYMFNVAGSNANKLEGISCKRAQDCVIRGDAYLQVARVGVARGDTGDVVFNDVIGKLFESDYMRNNNRYTIGCRGKNMVADRCEGFIPAGQGVIGQCGAGSQAPWQCTSECTWQAGSCAVGFDCGNGLVEGDELCDDGQFNGQYGQCAGLQSFAPDVDAVVELDDQGFPIFQNNLACYARHPQYCGNAAFDVNEAGAPLEYCENVLNFDFMTDPVGLNHEYRVRMSTNGMVHYLEQAGALSEEQINQIEADVWSTMNQECGNVGNNPGAVLLCLVLSATMNEGAFPFIANINEYKDKHCSGDPGLLCRVDSDCQGSGPERALDIYNFDAIGSSYVSENWRDFGRCVPFEGKFGSPYNKLKSFSCAADCQGPGRYCGDSVVDSAEGEQCDDGNRVDGDACHNDCTGNVNPNVAVAQLAGSCGDGTIQSPNLANPPVREVCDLAGRNGLACSPGYGQSCAYCSADCQEVLTADPVAFCGNGQIDRVSGAPQVGQLANAQYEACDTKFIPQQDGLLLPVVVGPQAGQAGNAGDPLGVQLNENELVLGGPTLPREDKICPDKGVYSCNADCRQLTEDCVSCGLTQNEPGPVPKLAVLNPLTQIFHNSWNRDLNIGFIRKEPHYTYFNEFASGRYNLQQALLSAEQVGRQDRLQPSILCREEYAVVFNATTLARQGGQIGGGDRLTQNNGEAALQWLVSNRKLGYFSYPVNGERQEVQNEIIASPAIPSGYVRIIVKWNKDDNTDVRFLGNVYNADFSSNLAQQNGGRISYTDLAAARGALCSFMQIRNDGFLSGGYWWPWRCQIFNDAFYMNAVTSLGRTSSQATTVKIDVNRNGAPYAFFVGAVGNDDVNNGISTFLSQDVTVEVYRYKDGQNPTYSLFPPAQKDVFKMKLARPSGNAGLARYWHVFNIVQKTVNGNTFYDVEQVDGNLRNGLISTDFVDVQCHTPNTPCNRG